MYDASSSLKAFKRRPSVDVSKWYMGSLITTLAEARDTNGAFCLLQSTLMPGNEPPPHVHSREDELFYVLDGEFDVYVGENAFKVETGEAVFLPRSKPHAFVIRSPKLHLLTLFTPAGLEDAFRSLSAPAERLELPTGALTYATTPDLTHTAEQFGAHGVRLLALDEVADQLLSYPRALRSR